jgi:ubiquinone biosynthesis protein
LFTTFNPTPIAAASLAQVHAATLPDGSEVVVKVKRPNI